MKKLLAFLFAPKITDEYIFKKLSKRSYIRNGETFGKGNLEIGFGRTMSGYGDWGWADYIYTNPLAVVIDKDYNILSSKTDSFFNSRESQRVEIVAKEIQKCLGKKLIVTNPLLKKHIDESFAVLSKNDERIRIDVNF